MFAAATREVVFSNPEVVRKVNADFVPVALKAATVANPPDGPEGDLYRAIRRTRPAPQGICTLNSAGHVLAWALSFQDEARIPRFFDHALTRYRAAADQPIYAERFRRFPSMKLPDVPPAASLQVPPHHKHGEACVGAPKGKGSGLAGTVIGRRLNAEGTFVKNTRRQENYMEARVQISQGFQTQLIQLASAAGTERFRLPDAMCRTLIAPAYLGQLDVNPLGVQPGANENRLRKWTLFGKATKPLADGTVVVRLSGTSHVEGGHVAQPNGPTWDHVVKLKWQGFARVKGLVLTRVCMHASGSEKLSWGNANLQRSKEPEAEHLMAGHMINVDSRVEYGIVLER